MGNKEMRNKETKGEGEGRDTRREGGERNGKQRRKEGRRREEGERREEGGRMVNKREKEIEKENDHRRETRKEAKWSRSKSPLPPFGTRLANKIKPLFFSRGTSL